jgi:hypothetical protein
MPAVIRFRVEIDDEHGTAAMVIDPPPVSPGQAARLAAITNQAVTALAALPGVASIDHARQIILAILVRQSADQDAYERVARQRGLLPL